MILNILKRVLADIKQYKLAFILFAIYNVIVRKFFHAFCPFLITFGIPCAGCGLTRACICLLTFQFNRAMRLNPAAPLWIALILYFLIVRYILGRKVRYIEQILGIVSFITLIIYLYRMFTMFPGDPPLVIHHKNIMSFFVESYNQKLQLLGKMW